MNAEIIDRFWKRVLKTSNTIGCWEWINPSHPFGYGRLKVGKKIELAHRLSYKIHFGDITPSQCVLHKCDNPRCVNPNHLFLGNRNDNAKDRTLKGRTFKGSQVTISIFNEQQIKDIRSSTKTISQLSKDYGVSYQHMWLIVKRKSWKHI
jgi:hypothetical protein